MTRTSPLFTAPLVTAGEEKEEEEKKRKKDE
jgi:hypothetical protein